MSTGRQTTARQYLGLNGNVAVLALSIFGLGLGEELWQSYLPKYLTALGASGAMVGLFSSLKELLDGMKKPPSSSGPARAMAVPRRMAKRRSS